ncbi:SOS response-associated peptidase family protein [Caballeronia novacaledonica]|uniref:Abasic site processing protein n=1 Tax=Caballeronia novacaledonica TaxID=1544861 RepID=A0AA37MKC4_9BURK|nr:SOS response-associated peptidase family protein [Caballeronia novacaledonica]
MRREKRSSIRGRYDVLQRGWKKVCTSYESNPKDRFDVFSLFPAPNFDYKRDIYKDYDAPIFRRFDGAYSTDAATFGLVPRKFIPKGAKVFTTMNARSETVGQKESFRSAWNKLQLALIPCNRFYEPNYETGKAVRWRIGTAGGAPLAIAGLWREWKDPTDGSKSLSMTMLTVNADDHPLMKRFHKPGAEKRSVVIIPPTEYEDWLSCKSTDEARSFLQLYPADAMHAEPFPLPPREPAQPKQDLAQASLLADNGG